jgi:hypothetical protein
MTKRLWQRVRGGSTQGLRAQPGTAWREDDAGEAGVRDKSRLTFVIVAVGRAQTVKEARR